MKKQTEITNEIIERISEIVVELATLIVKAKSIKIMLEDMQQTGNVTWQTEGMRQVKND